MPYSWEGNRRSGHSSQTLVVLHQRAQGLVAGDEHPHTLSLVEYGELNLFYNAVDKYFTCGVLSLLTSYQLAVCMSPSRLRLKTFLFCQAFN